MQARFFASKPPQQPPQQPASGSSGDNDGRSFRGQMVESITTRMAREKAQREKIAQERQESATTRNAATTFSEWLAAAGGVPSPCVHALPDAADARMYVQ